MTADHDHALALELFDGVCPTCEARTAAAPPQPEPVEVPSPTQAFDGATYQPEIDYRRLGDQARRVWDALADGSWRTLAQLAAATGDPEASVSARLRDFRKKPWGGHVVERRRAGAARGTYEYRLVRSAEG